MVQDKYEIEVKDDEVIFWGYVPILHLLKLMNFFEEMGFDEAEIGYENSTLRLMKSKKSREKEDVDEDEKIQNVFEDMYEEEKMENKELRKMVNEEKDENLKLKSRIHEEKDQNLKLKSRIVDLEHLNKFYSKKIKGEIDGI